MLKFLDGPFWAVYLLDFLEVKPVYYIGSEW